MKQLFTLLLLGMVMITLTGAGPASEKLMGTPFTGGADPDGVLKIMEASVRDRNFEDFRNVLADSFVYVPDVGTEAMYPSIDWTKWDIAEEIGFVRRLLSPVLSSELYLRDNIDERGMPIDNRALYILTYRIVIEGRPFVAVGTFHFVETDNRWYLWKWEETDFVTNPETGGYYSNSGEVRASLSP